MHPEDPVIVYAVEGEPVILVAPVTDGEDFQWSRTDGALDSRWASSSDGVRATLTTECATLADSGEYVLHMSGAPRKKMRLEVRGRTPADAESTSPFFLRRLTDLAVKVGARTRLIVEIQSDSEVQVTWYRNSRRLQPSVAVNITSEGRFHCLEVNAAAPEDSGRWTCAAANKTGRAECSAHLNVIVPKAYKRPEFLEELRAILTDQGTVSLECKVVGVPTPTLRWFKDSEEIRAGDVFALTANPEDATSLGIYTCEATNCMGKAYSSSKVHVVGRGSREGSLKPADSAISSEPAPIFISELQEQRVKVGEPLELSCRVGVPPWPKSVVWYNKNGRADPAECTPLEDGAGGLRLSIPSVTWDHEGEWKCVAASAGGRLSVSTCYVNVDVPKNYRKPRFMENLKAVLTEEGLVSFECKVVGFPTPQLSWFKDGLELKPGDVYQLTGSNSLGSYCCIAKNCMGQASSQAELTVEDIQNQLDDEERMQLFSENKAPKFVQVLKSQEAKINEDFRFSVKVSISPEPTLTWYRDDQPIDDSLRYKTTKESKGIYHLDIRQLEIADQAEWKCIATNEFGHSVTSCFLKLVIPRHFKKPRFLENLRAILSEEGAVNLECKVIGVPQPVLKWYKDGEELKPGDIHRIISGQDGTCCLGTYTCEAQNCMGIAASSASLLGFEDTMKAGKTLTKSEPEPLQRNISLSTIHEERTSQLYDTPVGDITLDDKGEISFSFSGKEVSVSLYETPDLTEEEALQIVEMYADQLSENITEQNVVELPPLRFVKETSTSGNLLMEAIVIDVSPDYFMSAEDDMRTEADMEDISIVEEVGVPTFPVEITEVPVLHHTIEELPARPPRKKSESIKSADDYYSLSKEKTESEKRKLGEENSESDQQSFGTAASIDANKANSTNKEIGEEIIKKPEHPTIDKSPKRMKRKERRESTGSRKSSSGSEKSLDSDFVSNLMPKVVEDMSKRLSTILKISKVVQSQLNAIEDEVILQSAQMSSSATAKKSLEVIDSLKNPLTDLQKITNLMKEDSIHGEKVISTFQTYIVPIKILHQNLAIIEKCVEFEGNGRTLVQRTSICLVETLAKPIQSIFLVLQDVCRTLQSHHSSKNMKEMHHLLTDTINALLLSEESIKSANLIREASEILQKNEKEQSKPEVKENTGVIQNVWKPILKLQKSLESVKQNICIEQGINMQEYALDLITRPIQELQNALETIEEGAVKESNEKLYDINSVILQGIVDPMLALRNDLDVLKTKMSPVMVENTLDNLMNSIHNIKSNLISIGEQFNIKDIEPFEENQRMIQNVARNLLILQSNVEMLSANDTCSSLTEKFDKLQTNLAKLLEAVLHLTPFESLNVLKSMAEPAQKLNESFEFLKSNDIDKFVISATASIDTLRHYISKTTILENMDVTDCLHSSITSIEDLKLSFQKRKQCISNMKSNESAIDESEKKDNVTCLTDIANKIKHHILVATETQQPLEPLKDFGNLENVSQLAKLANILIELRDQIGTSEVKVHESQESPLSFSELTVIKELATPLNELNFSLNVATQQVLDDYESIKSSKIDYSSLHMLIKPLQDFHENLTVIQHNIQSQLGESLNTFKAESSIAKSLRELDSCILEIQQQYVVEIADDMSTLQDISGMKSIADLKHSIEKAVIKTVNVPLENVEFLDECQKMKSIHSLHNDLIDIEKSLQIDDIDKFTYLPLKSFVDCVTKLKNKLEDSVLTETGSNDRSAIAQQDFANSLLELQNLLEYIINVKSNETVSTMSDVNISDEMFKKINTITDSLLTLQQDINLVSKIIENEFLPEKTVEKLSSQRENLATKIEPIQFENVDDMSTITDVSLLKSLATPLQDLMHAVGAIQQQTRLYETHDKLLVEDIPKVNERLILSLEEVLDGIATVQNVLTHEGVTSISNNIVMNEVKEVAQPLQDLSQKLFAVKENLISQPHDAEQSLKDFSYDSTLAEALVTIEKCFAVLEQHDLLDMTHISDMCFLSDKEEFADINIEREILTKTTVIDNALAVFTDIQNITNISEHVNNMDQRVNGMKDNIKQIQLMVKEPLAQIIQNRNKINDLVIATEKELNSLEVDILTSKTENTGKESVQKHNNVLRNNLKKINDMLTLIFNYNKQKEIINPLKNIKTFTSLMDSIPISLSRQIPTLELIIGPLQEICHQFELADLNSNATQHADITVISDDIIYPVNTMLTAVKDNSLVTEDQECLEISKHLQDLKSILDANKQELSLKGQIIKGSFLKEISTPLHYITNIISNNNGESVIAPDTITHTLLSHLAEPVKKVQDCLSVLQRQIMSPVDDDTLTADISLNESYAEPIIAMQKELSNFEECVMMSDQLPIESQIVNFSQIEKSLNSFQDNILTIQQTCVSPEEKACIDMLKSSIIDMEKTMHTVEENMTTDLLTDKCFNSEENILQQNEYSLKILELCALVSCDDVAKYLKPLQNISIAMKAIQECTEYNICKTIPSLELVEKTSANIEKLINDISLPNFGKENLVLSVSQIEMIEKDVSNIVEPIEIISRYVAELRETLPREDVKLTQHILVMENALSTFYQSLSAFHDVFVENILPQDEILDKDVQKDTLLKINKTCYNKKVYEMKDNIKKMILLSPTLLPSIIEPLKTIGVILSSCNVETLDDSKTISNIYYTGNIIENILSSEGELTNFDIDNISLCLTNAIQSIEAIQNVNQIYDQSTLESAKVLISKSSMEAFEKAVEVLNCYINKTPEVKIVDLKKMHNAMENILSCNIEDASFLDIQNIQQCVQDIECHHIIHNEEITPQVVESLQNILKQCDGMPISNKITSVVSVDEIKNCVLKLQEKIRSSQNVEENNDKLQLETLKEPLIELKSSIIAAQQGKLTNMTETFENLSNLDEEHFTPLHNLLQNINVIIEDSNNLTTKEVEPHYLSELTKSIHSVKEMIINEPYEQQLTDEQFLSTVVLAEVLETACAQINAITNENKLESESEIDDLLVQNKPILEIYLDRELNNQSYVIDSAVAMINEFTELSNDNKEFESISCAKISKIKECFVQAKNLFDKPLAEIVTKRKEISSYINEANSLIQNFVNTELVKSVKNETLKESLSTSLNVIKESLLRMTGTINKLNYYCRQSNYLRPTKGIDNFVTFSEKIVGHNNIPNAIMVLSKLNKPLQAICKKYVESDNLVQSDCKSDDIKVNIVDIRNNLQNIQYIINIFHNELHDIPRSTEIAEKAITDSSIIISSVLDDTSKTYVDCELLKSLSGPVAQFSSILRNEYKNIMNKEVLLSQDMEEVSEVNKDDLEKKTNVLILPGSKENAENNINEIVETNQAIRNEEQNADSIENQILETKFYETNEVKENIDTTEKEKQKIEVSKEHIENDVREEKNSECKEEKRGTNEDKSENEAHMSIKKKEMKETESLNINEELQKNVLEDNVHIAEVSEAQYTEDKETEGNELLDKEKSENSELPCEEKADKEEKYKIGKELEQDINNTADNVKQRTELDSKVEGDIKIKIKSAEEENENNDTNVVEEDKHAEIATKFKNEDERELDLNKKAERGASKEIQLDTNKKNEEEVEQNLPLEVKQECEEITKEKKYEKEHDTTLEDANKKNDEKKVNKEENIDTLDKKAIQIPEENTQCTAEVEVMEQAKEEDKTKVEEEKLKKVEDESVNKKAKEDQNVFTEKEETKNAEIDENKIDIAEAKKKVETEAKKKAEEEEVKKKDEDESKKEAEDNAEKILEDEAAKKKAEAMKITDKNEAQESSEEEHKKITEAEAEKRSEEREAKKIADEESNKKVEEEKEEGELQNKVEDKSKIKAEAETKKKEEQAKKKADEEESKKKSEAETKIKEEEAKQKAVEEEFKKKAEAEAKIKVEEEEARKKAEEESKKKVEEEEVKKKSEEESMKKAEEDEAKKKAEEEAIKKAEEIEAKKKAEEESKKKSEEEEAKKKADEKEKKKAEEEELKKKAEAETKIKEEEAKKKADEEGLKKKAEAEAKKKVEEEEAKKKAEEEAKKKADEEEMKKKTEAEFKIKEEEAKKKADEEELKKKAEIEAKIKVEEEEAKKKAEEEAKKKADEEEMKKKAEAETKIKEGEAKKKTDEEELKKKAEIEAKIKVEEEEAKKKAEEEAKKKADEEEMKKKAEAVTKIKEEEAKKKAEEKTKKKVEEEEAKKKTEEESKKIADEEEIKKKAEAESKIKEEEAKKEADEEELKKKAVVEAKKKVEGEEAIKKAEEEAKKKADEEEMKKKAEAEITIKEEEAKKKTDEEELKKKAEIEAKIKVEEEVAKKKAEEEAKKKADEEEMKKKAEAETKIKEEEAKKKADEEELKKKAEVEAKIKVEEEEAKKKAEEEAKKKADEEEMKKKAEAETKIKEEEAKKKADEEELKKKAEVEAKKKVEEEEAKKKAEEEAKKKADKEEMKKKTEAEFKIKEEEAKKKADEEELKKKAEIEAKIKDEEEEAKKKSKEEAKKKADEEEMKKKAEAETKIKEGEAKKKTDEEEFKKKAEIEAKIKVEEEEAKKKAEEEVKKKADEEELKKKAEVEAKKREEESKEKADEEEFKIKAEAESNLKLEEEEAKKKAEEEAKKKAEEESLKTTEEEDTKKKADTEAKKKVEEEVASKKAEAEIKKKAEEIEIKKNAEEKSMKKADDEAKKKAEEEEMRKTAESEAKIKTEELKEKKEIEADAKKTAEEEEVNKRAESEAIMEAEKEEAKKKAEEDSKKKAEEEDVKKKAEAEAKIKAEEEDAKNKAEKESMKKREDEAKKKAEEEKLKIQAEDDAKKRAEEEAKKKVKEEEETRKKAKEEEDAKKKAKEAEEKKKKAKKKADIEEAKKKADEESKKKAEEEEVKNKAEVEAMKKAEEEKAKKKAEEEEAKKKSDGEETMKKTEEESEKKAETEAKKKAEIDVAMKKAEEESKKRAEEEESKIKAEAEAQKKTEDEEEVKKKAKEEEEKKKKAEEESKKKSEAKAKKKAELEVAKKKAEEESNKKTEEESKKKVEEEEAKKKTEEASKKKTEEEEAKKKADAEAKKKAEEEEVKKKAEAEHKKKSEEIEAKKKAEEESKKKAEEEELKKKTEAEAMKKSEEEKAKKEAEEESKKQAETDAKKQAEKEKANKKAEMESQKSAEEEEVKKKAETETKKKEEKVRKEAEAKKKAKAEAKKQSEEEKAIKKTEEEEAKRKAEEEEAKKKAEEDQTKKIAEEECKKKSETEAMIKAEIDVAKKKAEEESKKRAEEEESKIKAEADAMKKAEDEEVKKKAKEEEKKKKAEEESKKKAETEAKKKAEEEEAKKKAIEEVEKKKKVEEESKKKTEEEETKKKADAEAKKKSEEEEAKKKAESDKKKSESKSKKKVDVKTNKKKEKEEDKIMAEAEDNKKTDAKANKKGAEEEAKEKNFEKDQKKKDELKQGKEKVGEEEKMKFKNIEKINYTDINVKSEQEANTLSEDGSEKDEQDENKFNVKVEKEIDPYFKKVGEKVDGETRKKNNLISSNNQLIDYGFKESDPTSKIENSFCNKEIDNNIFYSSESSFKSKEYSEEKHSHRSILKVDEYKRNEALSKRSERSIKSSSDASSSYVYSQSSKQKTPGPRDSKKKPIFSTRLTDRTAVEGSRVKLTCSVLGSPEPNIQWFRNGVLLTDKNKFIIKFGDGLTTLEVLNAEPHDSADYTCTATNENGTVSCSASLKVYAGVETTPIPPTFTRSIKDTYHVTEDEMVLECRIRGQPRPVITWIKDGKKLTSESRYQMNYLADGLCRLIVNRPDPSDSGMYTCRAENPLWSDEISHRVQFAGRDLHLAASSHGFETVRSVRSGHESRRPYFSRVLADHAVPIGGTIALQVEVGGGGAEVEWRRGGAPLPKSAKIKKYVEKGVHTLAVENASIEESGIYTCTVKNEHGSVDTTATVSVLPPGTLRSGKAACLVSRPEADVSVTEGEDFTVSLRAQGDPKPKVIWMKGLRDITNNWRSLKENSDDYFRFTLKRTLMSDAGTYCILAKNCYGCDRAFVTVFVRQRLDSESYESDKSEYNYSDASYMKDVPQAIVGEPEVSDRGKDWVSLRWNKPPKGPQAPVLAYRVDAWLQGAEGGARWQSLGLTPVNGFDAFQLTPGAYLFRVTPRNRYGWGPHIQTKEPISVGGTMRLPEFTTPLPGQIKVLVGDSTTMSCTVIGTPTPTVAWYKDGQEIDGAVMSSGGRCVLHIARVEHHHEGRYTCEATGPEGRTATFARLSVVNDKKIYEADENFKRYMESETIECAPVFSMRLRDRRVQATYPVRLTCRVEGRPAPIITWTKDDEIIEQNDHYSFWASERFHTLEISSTTLDDAGKYSAHAANPLGAVRCSAILTVDKGLRAYLAPDFVLAPDTLYRVPEGTELRVRAVVEAYPSVGVSWHRDGLRLRPSRRTLFTLDRDGELEMALAHVTRRDSGIYTVTASNEVGKATCSTRVEVVASNYDQHYKDDAPLLFTPSVPYSKEPIFIKKPRSSEAKEGDTVVILCEVAGDPKPEVLWLRDFLKPEYYRDATQFRRVGAGPEYRLEIPHCKLDHTGAYTVIASNCHGQTKAIISLQIYAKGPDEMDHGTITTGRVHVLPRIIRELKDMRCCDGDAVTFECLVQGTPSPLIHWEKDGQLIHECEDFMMDMDGEVAHLTIGCVYPEDEGVYTCTAYNELGKVYTSSCLIVDVPEEKENLLCQQLTRPPMLLSAGSTPRSTPRSTPCRSMSPQPHHRAIRQRDSMSQTPSRTSRWKLAPPKFFAVPFNRVAEEGENVSFRCSIAGHPVPKVYWDKDGSEIQLNPRISIREKDDDRVLTINSVKYEDSGIYRVTLENEAGRIEATACLDVINLKGTSPAMRVTENPRTSPYVRRHLNGSHYRVGERLRLSGEIRGSPSPTSKWYRNGNILEMNDRVFEIRKGDVYTLVINSVKASDSGIYTLVGSNELGSTSSWTKVIVENKIMNGEIKCIGEHQPHILTVLKDITVVEGKATEIQLTLENCCVFSFTWIRNGTVLPDSEIYKYVDYGNGVIGLRLEDIYIQDEGVYTCIIRNGFGSVKSSCNIKVKESNTGIAFNGFQGYPEPVLVQEGGDATFNLTINSKVKFANPMAVWQIAGKEIANSSDKYKLINNGCKFTLKIFRVEGKESGYIRCAIRVPITSNEDETDEYESLWYSTQLCVVPNVFINELTDSAAANKTMHVKPKFTSKIENVIIPVGGKALFNAYFCGYPAPSVSWFILDRLISPCKRFNINNTPTTTTLEISDAERSDSAVYKVIIENEQGIDSMTALLQIEDTEESQKPAPLYHVDDGMLFDSHYSIHNVIGRGHFGSVKLIKNKKSGEQLAAKFVKISKQKDKEVIMSELEILHCLKHPKLIQLVDAFMKPNQMIIVTEYISGGQLFERVSEDDFTLTERDCILFMTQILEGVAFMHSKNIVHLDLKPENIMCHTRPSHEIKIIDFGLAKRLRPNEEIRTLCGTAEFIAPEVVNFDPISTASDMWSIGVICYILLSGLSPFAGDTVQETYSNILRVKYDFEDESFDKISEDAKDFIRDLFVKSMDKRPSAAKCLQNKWMMQHQVTGSATALSTEKLRKFVIQSKWQMTGNAIRAVGRMASLCAISRMNTSRIPNKTDNSSKMSFAEENINPEKTTN